MSSEQKFVYWQDIKANKAAKALEVTYTVETEVVTDDNYSNKKDQKTVLIPASLAGNGSPGRSIRSQMTEAEFIKLNYRSGGIQEINVADVVGVSDLRNTDYDSQGRPSRATFQSHRWINAYIWILEEPDRIDFNKSDPMSVSLYKGKYYVCGDGHRRMSVLKALKREKVVVRVQIID